MALLAILGFAIAIYQGFFYERRGNITITIDPPARVFDLHRSIGGLEVSYAGEDLRLSKKTLWILTAAIRNTGNAEIKKGDYDDQAPLGLQIDGGEIVDVPTVRTPITYLQQNFKVKTVNQKIFFSPVIVEPEDSIYISFLILGPENTRPTISAFGKIAGARSVTLINAESGASTASWVQRVIGADAFWIHPARIAFYGLCGLLSFGLLVALGIAISSPFDEIRKKREVASRRAKIEQYQRGEDLSKELRLLTELYVSNGDWALQAMKNVLKSLQSRNKYHDQVVNCFGEDELDTIMQKLWPYDRNGNELISELTGKNVLKFDGAKSVIQENIELELTQLAEYLDVDLDKYPKYPSLREEMERARNRHPALEREMLRLR